MAITENQAQLVLLVRSIEQAPSNGEIWSAYEAKEATRTVKDMTGENCPFDLFLAYRAEFVIKQVAKRNSHLVKNLCRRPSLATIFWMLLFAAFLLGFFTDNLFTDRRINVIEWSIVLIIFWNWGFFTFLFIRYVRSHFRLPTRRFSLWSADQLGRWQLRGTASDTDNKAEVWIRKFKYDWRQNCLTLNKHRVSFIFNAASIALAIGMLSSLYMRGLFKEYRAGWESTFMSADTIHSMASFLLAPGAWIFNMTIPDVEHIATLQIPNGSGEVAGDWIHLYAGSILVCVIIPRLVLLFIAGHSTWRMQNDFPLSVNSIYYTRLRSVQAGDQATVLIIPFRYELSSAMKSNLTKLLERNHGLSATVKIEQSVSMGNNTNDWRAALGHERYIAIFVIFNLAATAEPDIHGRFLKRLLKESKGRFPVIPIVDTGTYADREKARFAQRCEQWRSVLDAFGCTPLFLNLQSLDQEGTYENIETVFDAYN